ncbi:TM2 domain-containing protein 3 [Blomia tropicalis]|nr:TM2 domain-containing protein 3 [Blomia tropicalis]
MKFIHRLVLNLLVCMLLALIRNQINSLFTDEDDPILMSGFMPGCQCNGQDANCLVCNFNYSCIYGTYLNTTCTLLDQCDKKNSNTLIKEYQCSFCYQLPPHLYNCSTTTTCQLHSRYKALCTVPDDIICMGKRKFFKYVRCEFTSGYKWSTALLLSITLGGFGIDRFYLGNWQEGVGKLFSFGGLGIWTLIDVILIATGYLKPSDGSIYV